jgi:anti-sigma-K factor RskA
VASTIRAWEQRLAPFAEAAPPITPPPQVWKRIALRLGLDAVLPSARQPWWAGVAFWRGLALASFVAVAVLTGTLVSQQRADESIVVVLAGQNAPPAMIATLDRGSRVMTVKAVGGAPVPAGRALELWMLPDGAAPRSLGVMPASGVARITLPALPDVALANVPALAVSLEQAGGSPTGATSGWIVTAGIARFTVGRGAGTGSTRSRVLKNKTKANSAPAAIATHRAAAE